MPNGHPPSPSKSTQYFRKDYLALLNLLVSLADRHKFAVVNNLATETTTTGEGGIFQLPVCNALALVKLKIGAERLKMPPPAANDKGRQDYSNGGRDRVSSGPFDYNNGSNKKPRW